MARVSDDRLNQGEDFSDAQILIIDDEQVNIDLLRKILGKHYAAIRSTTDPTRTLDMVAAEPPDVILLDLHMKSMDGFQVMEGLRGLIGDTYMPILVLTADVTAETRRRALSIGANDFLNKPFDLEEVFLRLTNLLRTRYFYLELQREKGSLEHRVAERTKAAEESRSELETSVRALRRTDDQRRRLLGSLVQAQEDERARIASDIHDDSIQIMIAVGMRLGSLRRKASDRELLEPLQEIEDVVTLSIERLRKLMFFLRPPVLDREGLKPALVALLTDLSETRQIRYEIHDRLEREPPPQARTIAFRISQEAVSNIRKHSKADTVEVFLETRGEGSSVKISDDGEGFDIRILEDLQARPGHIGVTSMQERAEIANGWFRMDSSPGVGTVVEFWIPDGT